MILRTVYVKLKDEHCNPAGRAAVVDSALAVFPTIPGVLGVEAGVPADAPSGKAWDVVLLVRFADVEAVEAYRVHPIHTRWKDEELVPRMTFLKAWNFAI